MNLFGPLECRCGGLCRCDRSTKRSLFSRWRRNGQNSEYRNTDSFVDSILGDENYETTSMPDSLSRLAQPHSIDTDSLLMQPSPIEQYHGQIAEFMAKMGQVLERARLPSITFSPALGSSQDDGIPRGILSKTSSFSNLSSFNTRENYAAETLSYAIPDKAGSMTAEPTLSRRIDFSSILSQEEYWKSGLPLFIDILCQESILLERWVMSFEAQ